MTKNKIENRNSPAKYFDCSNIFEFEDWMINEGDGTSHALGAAFALAQIPDDRYIKISARQQKMLWGQAYIGRKSVCLRNGRFELVWSSGFGQDHEVSELFEYISYHKA